MAIVTAFVAIVTPRADRLSHRDGGRACPGPRRAGAVASTRPDDRRAQHWPDQARWLSPLLYTAAGLVGASRVLDDAHWTSDAVFGAALGTVAGRETVRWIHDP